MYFRGFKFNSFITQVDSSRNPEYTVNRIDIFDQDMNLIFSQRFNRMEDVQNGIKSALVNWLSKNHSKPYKSDQKMTNITFENLS